MVDIYNQFKDFKSFEVAFTNGDGILQKIFATVKSIENDRLVIIANNEGNKNIFANVDDELTLYIYTENGIYSSTSKIFERTKGLITTEYVISYPAHSKHSQRREYFRAEIPVKFEMVIYTDNTYTEQTLLKGTTRNICGKGMSFLSNKPFIDYKALELELSFEDRTVKTSAELVYSQTLKLNGKPIFVHAFTFTDISQKNIDFIVKKCFLYQLDLRKKPI